MGKGKILIVEGEASVAEEMKKCLIARGYEIPAICTSGEEVVEKVSETDPDLCVIDIHPAGKMNGIETAEKIRIKHSIPVVFLSGYGDMELINMAKITEQYILKPFDEHELDTAIQLSCSKHAMEKALRENERTIRALLNVTTDPLFILDADGAFLALNEMMAKRLGKPAEEVLHMPITGLIAGGGITLPLAERVELAKSGKPIRFEEAVKDQWYDTHIYPITDAAGNVTHIAVFSHDITDRKKAADELAVANLNLLQEKENLLIFTAALDSMDDSVIITDTYGVIKYVNHAFERKFGYKPSEVIGKHLSEFKSPESTYALDRQSFLGDHKSVWTGYPVMRNKFGLRIPLSLKSSPIIKENQTINRVFVLREKL